MDKIPPYDKIIRNQFPAFPDIEFYRFVSKESIVDLFWVKGKCFQIEGDQIINYSSSFYSKLKSLLRLLPSTLKTDYITGFNPPNWHICISQEEINEILDSPLERSILGEIDKYRARLHFPIYVNLGNNYYYLGNNTISKDKLISILNSYKWQYLNRYDRTFVYSTTADFYKSILSEGMKSQVFPNFGINTSETNLLSYTSPLELKILLDNYRKEKNMDIILFDAGVWQYLSTDKNVSINTTHIFGTTSRDVFKGVNLENSNTEILEFSMKNIEQILNTNNITRLLEKLAKPD